jgi:hypothetical protein
MALRLVHLFAVPAMALVFAVSVQARANRTFVSTIGDDTDTTVNCPASAPCRTLAGGLSATDPGGEVVVLKSGDYGPATIFNPVVITAIGVDASISLAVGGVDAIDIHTTGAVTIIGFNLHGEGAASSGIFVVQGSLRLYNMLIEGFEDGGVVFDGGGDLAIYNSAINDNLSVGVVIGNATGSAYVNGTSFNNNGAGVVVGSGKVTIAGSSLEFNSTGFMVDSGGTLTLVDDRATFNGAALVTESGGALYFSRCLITNNTTAYQIAPGSTMVGTNPGTSLIAPGQATVGTLGTPVALQ